MRSLMAADLGRGVDMTAYYYAAETLNLLFICLLFMFHAFRLRHFAKKNHDNRPTKSPSLFGVIDLKTVSFVMLSFYVVRGIVILFTFFTNKQWTYLNASSCHFLMVFSNTLIQFARYNLHLFVAMRSRLSSYTQTYSVWSKIGFVVMLSDLIHCFFTWIIPGWIVMDISPDGTQCVTLGFSLEIIFWVIANDTIVSGYSLLVFVWPLRKVIALEKQQNNIEMNIQPVPLPPQSDPESSIDENTRKITVDFARAPAQNQNVKKVKSISDITRRIMWCSLGAMSTTAIACGIALTIGILQGITSPILMFLRCYMVVMQFADIDMNEIDADQTFWRGLVTMFQWDQWGCGCFKKAISKKEQTMTKTESTNSTTTSSKKSNASTNSTVSNSSNASTNITITASPTNEIR